MASKSKCVKAIRALLVANKNSLFTREILNDYIKMEGEPVPFESFGYKTFDEFLRDSNQFILTETRQGIKVTAKPLKAIQHVVELVKGQNSVKTKKKTTNMLPPQRGLRTSTSDNMWNTTEYAKVYTEMRNRSVKKVSTHPAHLMQAAFNNGSNAATPFRNSNNNTGEMRPILKQSNIKPVPKDQQNTNDQKIHGNGVQSNAQNRSITSRTYPSNSNSMSNAAATAQNRTPNRNQQQNDRFTKKLSDFGATKNSVQSRLAIKKQISLDQVDFVQHHQDQVQSFVNMSLDSFEMSSEV